MKYRIATVNIPRTAYAPDDREWQKLPDGERIIHVFSQTMTPDGSFVVVIEKDD